MARREREYVDVVGVALAQAALGPRPRTRRLLRVEISDQIVTDRVINELMGKDASARFRFIMERAEDAQELDV
jgi:DNA gyrase/topoisomerase IV subunit B